MLSTEVCAPVKRCNCSTPLRLSSRPSVCSVPSLAAALLTNDWMALTSVTPLASSCPVLVRRCATWMLPRGSATVGGAVTGSGGGSGVGSGAGAAAGAVAAARAASLAACAVAVAVWPAVCGEGAPSRASSPVLVTIWLLISSICGPVWRIWPALSMRAAVTSRRAALSLPALPMFNWSAWAISWRRASMLPVFSVVVPPSPSTISRWLLSVPLLSRPLAVISRSALVPWVAIAPLLLSWPSADSVKGPEAAASWPALRTPSPASVPISVILCAYMPPSCATSSANCGFSWPLPAALDCSRPSAASSLTPVTTRRSCAHNPALSATARASTWA